MSKKLVTVRNSTQRTIPLEGQGVPSKTLAKGSTHTVGPEYHLGNHFQSLVKKRMLVVLREETLSPPKPKAPKPAFKKMPAKKPPGSSSTSRQEDSKSKARADDNGADMAVISALNADGK